MKWFSKKKPAEEKIRATHDDEKAQQKTFTLYTDCFKNHAYVVGGTGQGKTNFLLLLIEALSRDEVQAKEPCSIIVIDPHGPGAMEGARMLMKKHGKDKVMVFDPMHTRFALNPLEISGSFRSLSDEDRLQKIQNQVGQLVSILVDVLGTDEARSPRMMWIFRGCLYFLYMLGNDVTFLDLYQLLIYLMELTKANRQEVIRKLFEEAGVKDEITKKTVEAISNYNADAYSVVLNRISNFTIPPGSITTRTFCSRKTTIPFDKIMDTPGMVTFFSVSKGDLPADFREVFTNTLLLNIWYRILERKGKGQQVYLIIDEFQTVQKLEALETIISEGRKFGLSLIAANQTLSSIKRKPLLDSLFGNCSFVGSFTTGPSDARILSELFGKDRYETIFRLSRGQMMMRLRPSNGSMPRTEIHTFPRAEMPADSPSEEEVVEYMEEDLEKLYGGAVEAKIPIYEEKKRQVLAELGECPMDTVQWEILAHLKTWEKVKLGSPEAVDHVNTASHIENELREKHARKKHETNNALLFLEGIGLVSKEPVYGKINRGKDDPRPNVVSDVSRSMDYIYKLTDDTRERYFGPLKPISPRAGDTVHLAAIQKRREECWANMEYVLVDQGEDQDRKPDLTVLRAELEDTGKGEKKESDIMSVYMAEEIETDPLRHKDRVLRNYEKNHENYHPKMTGMFRTIRFDVLMREHVEPMKQILKEKDRDSYVVEFLDLGFSKEDLVKRLNAVSSPMKKTDDSGPSSSDEKPAEKSAPPVEKQQKESTRQHEGQPTQLIVKRAGELRDVGYKENAIQGTLLKEFGHERIGEIKKAIQDLKPYEEIKAKMLIYRKLGFAEEEIRSVFSNEDDEKVKSAIEETKDVQNAASLIEKVSLCKQLGYDNPTIISKLSSPKEYTLEEVKGAVVTFDLIGSGACSREDITLAHSYLSKKKQQEESTNNEPVEGTAESLEAKTILGKFVNFGIVEPDEDSFTITLEEAGKVLGKSRAQAHRYFSKLKDDGFITKIGPNKYGLTAMAKEEIERYLD